MECVITIFGHIDVHKQPQGFPAVVKQVMHVEAENKQQLVDQLEGFTKAIILMQGMAVRNEPEAMQDFNKLDLERMWVPLHMITHLNAKVQALTGETPIAGPDGKFVDKTGKEAILQ